MLSGDNSILTRGAEAKISSDNAKIEEKIKLANNAAVADGLGELTYPNLKAELAKEFGVEGTDWRISAEDTNPWVVTVNDVVYPNASIAHSVAPTPTLTPTAKTLVQAFIDGELHVGDYVNYTPSNTSATITVTKNGIQGSSETGVGTGYDAEQTYTVDTTSDYKTTWRVLGLNEEQTNVILISGSPLRKTGTDPYLVLQGAEGYAYCEKTLDSICNIYANTNLADEVRSITIEDINNALGVEVTYTENPDGSKTPGKVYQTSDTETNIDAYNGVTSYTYQIKSNGDYAPENYLGTGTKHAGDVVYRTAYWYSQDSLTNSNSTAKDIIFTGTNQSDNFVKAYWVASPATWASSSVAYFGPSRVGGNTGCGGMSLFVSAGHWFSYSFGVRPVVSLKSGVTVDQIEVQSGIEEKGWTENHSNPMVGNGTITTGTVAN